MNLETLEKLEKIASLIFCEDEESLWVGIQILKGLKLPFSKTCLFLRDFGWKDYIICYDDMNVEDKEYITDKSFFYYEDETNELTSTYLAIEYHYPFLSNFYYQKQKIEIKETFDYSMSCQDDYNSSKGLYRLSVSVGSSYNNYYIEDFKPSEKKDLKLDKYKKFVDDFLFKIRLKKEEIFVEIKKWLMSCLTKI